MGREGWPSEIVLTARKGRRRDSMLNVEQAIREVGAVYKALTGRTIEGGRSDLPADVDPLTHIEGRYRHFKALVDAPLGSAAPGAATVGWAPPADVIELADE